MDYYIDIKIIADAEMRENILLNKVYTKFHKVLYSLRSSDIAVSFPKCHILLGDTIRIHGSSNRLLQVQESDWLGGLVGYCKITDVLSVPEKIQYRTISRKQSNMTEAKLRRLIKRGSIDNDGIKNYKAQMFKKGLDNPYLELESTSNANKHRRYIKFGELTDKPVTGHFDFFGLSKTATVPWF